MTKRPRFDYSPWQKAVVAELKELARQRRADLRVTGPQADRKNGNAVVRVRLHVAGIEHTEGGLELDAHEEFIVQVGRVPLVPPVVEVEHNRFLGHPHVLQGRRICLYLDASREWDPAGGAAAILNRLWDWLVDAAGARFDAATAMYHAVGGVLHQTDDTPTIVVREDEPNRRQQVARLVPRTTARFDLTYASDVDGLQAPVLTLGSDLPFGASSSFADLLRLLDDPHLDQIDARLPRVAPQAQAFITMLMASAIRGRPETEQYFVLAVPHPVGGPAHLLAGRLSAQTADVIRVLANKHGVDAMIDINSIDPTIPVQWCTVSDERKSVTTRRDDNRPVNGFIGKTIQIWGCGGLGSWIAEYVARAGATHITLCDPGTVTGGLLVRQNYYETDIGMNKAAALAHRLASIRNDLAITVETGAVPENTDTWLSADLIVDATVSRSITRFIDQAMAELERRAIIAQAATDAATGTLGIISLCPPGSPLTLAQSDQRAGERVLARGDLELYHRLWQDPLVGDELTPTRGCSAPTFHGSAADLAAVAATLTSILGTHLRTEEPMGGTHLVAIPHAGEGPSFTFIPHDMESDLDSTKSCREWA